MVSSTKIDLDVALVFVLQLHVKRLTKLSQEISEHNRKTPDSEPAKHLRNVLNHGFSWFIVAHASIINGHKKS